jgi:hypothetical protein
MYRQSDFQDMTAVNANKIFLRFLKGRSNRLAYSLQDRERNRKLIATGKEPEGNPRYEWLKTNVLETFEFLTPRMEAYDTQHPGDCISTKDLADLFISCLARLGVEFK